MKRMVLILPAVLCILALGASGCKKKPIGPTPIPGARTPVQNSGDGSFPPVTRGPAIPTDDGTRTTRLQTNPDGTIPNAGRDEFEGMLMDRSVFAASVVYFDFDRFNVRPSERAKVEAVATHLKGDATNKLLIEGHCDERGTEEYNRALGEKRAQSLRELLANLGVAPERVRTVSYGEDKPAQDGHNEEAWSKNRRGEFILLRPKQ